MLADVPAQREARHLHVFNLSNALTQHDMLSISAQRCIVAQPLMGGGDMESGAAAVEQHRYVETKLHHQVEHWLVHAFPPILVLLGPTGAGKTTTVQHVLAQHPELPELVIPATRGARLADFLGYWTMREGQMVFVEGILYRKLLEDGAVIVVDDAHTLGPELQLFNGLGDETRLLSCAELGVTLSIARGVRLVLIANPPSANLPPWERAQWQIPQQIIDRARVISVEDGLPEPDEQAIFDGCWEDLKVGSLGHPTTVRTGLLEVVRHLRGTPALGSWRPSVRQLVMLCHLIAQGLSPSEAYMQGVVNKFAAGDARTAAVEAFRAKFDYGPTDEGSTLAEGAQA